ncbi:MBL fold metallo-hydrolase [Ramlibacter sp. AW1]|uniref:MBL fold metallo-hydrolase n=1 Tax=Ramlibacter aurantiacus TaxID=2801330 RepID=A0A937D839_9BURK|nr:MBL fold metallo-hydrolase [Ramlibacter aurantiacus]MBL0421641.1 MBL fold metallo-hydrolase [Ramlibacter aurantiacus]
MPSPSLSASAPADAAPAPPRDPLHYPFEAPAPATAVEIAPGVRWVRMPLPFALDHINLWTLDDDGGWAIVDTGVCSPETTAGWTRILAEAGNPAVSRVFVTHMHPDHVGTAGWLTRRHGCRLWMTRGEYLQCRVLVSDTGREAPAEGEAFYRRAGWDTAAIETYRARFGNFGKHIHSLPSSFRRLVDGEEIRIGRHPWRVIVGRGHSPEHACLYSPDQRILVSGDQVLPRISSNVSVYPMEPDDDPMSDWFESIARIRAQVPDDVLVLPAHGLAFRGLHARLDRLRQGQDQALQRLRERLRQPQRAVDVFGALFARAITPDKPQLLSMATGESLACLNYLRGRGEAVCDTDADGVNWWRTPASVGAADNHRP